MKLNALIAACLAGAATFTAAPSAQAATGVYTDTLTKCIVQSTSDADKRVVVTWVFSIIALHPDVQSMMTVSPEDREGANKKIANLFETLLTKSCRTEATEAVKYEGDAAIGKSFEVLGQIAMRTLLTDPQVNAGLSGFAKYIDLQRIQEVLKPQADDKAPAKKIPAKTSKAPAPAPAQ